MPVSTAESPKQTDHGRHQIKTELAQRTFQEQTSFQLTPRQPEMPRTLSQRLLRLQGAYGNRAVLNMLGSLRLPMQAKLAINQPGDPFEQEADRVADHVMRMPDSALQPVVAGPTPDLQRACSCGESGAQCATCQEQDEEMVQREPDGPATMDYAPPIVDEVLGSPGRPLDPVTRAFMEPRFGLDFGHVRIHTDATAQESARTVNALAYTTGHNIVFGAGQFSPLSEQGRRLLAHELAHVVQQSGSHPGPALQAAAVRRTNSASASGTVLPEEQNNGLSTPRPMVQRLTCDSILNAQEAARVSGTEAHLAITANFAASAGKNMLVLAIPGASSKAYRTECGGLGEKMIDPQTVGGMAGMGIPDLAYRSGSVVELAEIKIGTWQCLDMAEKQVNNYVEKGNEPYNRAWALQKGITSFQLMNPSRFTPLSPLPVGGQKITVAWCEPGVIVYKPIKDEDSESYVCGTTDKGAIDKFLNIAFGKAQGVVDNYIDRTLDPLITKTVNQLTVGQAVKTSYRHAGRLLKKYLAKTMGPAAVPVDLLPENAVVDAVARYLDEQLHGQAESLLRMLANQFKGELLNRLRTEMQARVRNFVQESLNALCAAALAGAATVTIRELMKKLRDDISVILVPALVQVTKQIIKEAIDFLVESLIKAVLATLAAIVIVLVAIALLPEEGIAAALVGIGEGLVALGEAITAAIETWNPAFSF